MKKLHFMLVATAALAFGACSQDDELTPVQPDVAQGLKAVEGITADFGGAGQVTVTTSGSNAKKNMLTRALGDYSECAAFASEAAAVACPYSYEAAPSVPEDAINVSELGTTSYPVYKSTTFENGKSYYIDTDSQIPSWVDAWGANVKVYLKDGVTLNSTLNTNATVEYYVLEGASLNLTKDATAYNWGTLTIGNALQLTNSVFNYGTLTEITDLRMGNGAVLYSSTSVDAKITYSYGDYPAVYIEGDFKALDGFGLSGDLYVSGTMSGDININNGLKAHVGNVSTEADVTVTAGSQLYVDGDVTAASMKLDGNYNGASETVVKGTANISGNVDVASGTKGYIELLLCKNYTANSSDIWVGCKSDVAEKFELNGSDAKFTLANGVYLHAGSAVFASNSTMTMYAKSYFKVDGKLQMNNVGSVQFNSVAADSETPAIVEAATLGANYEDFSTTFTGNIGVDFDAWDYNSSTGLIDNNTGLKKISDVAAKTTIEESTCNPGYKGKDATTEPDPEPTPEPTPDPDEPDPTPVDGCDLTVDVPDDIYGAWIIQADDFAIHNGDVLYESIAKGNHNAGSDNNEEYVVVSATDKVVVSLTDICAMYEEYKGAVNGDGKPYVSEDGVLTVETYLWPAKRHYDEEKGRDVIEPIPAEEFGIGDDGVEGKYLVGDEKSPAVYTVNGKYKVLVSAYQSYNGGGNDAAMTSYVKVSFHISPLTAETTTEETTEK